MLLIFSAVSIEAGETSFSNVQTAAPPNIVLILLDDVAFADTSTFGGVAQTPSLTSLAETGLRFNRFHTAGLCAPTRAALLSGRNHHRMGYGSLFSSANAGYDHQWRKSTASVAEVLRRNGYSTAAFGKWHNTPLDEIVPVGPFERWPTGLGFEYFYGNMRGMTSQWEPSLWRNTVMVQQPKSPNEGYHLTTDLVDDAIDWIQTHQSLVTDKPYFVYFSTGAAHVPHHVSQSWIAKYRGKFDQGWDVLREEILIRQKRLRVVPDDTELTPRPNELPAWSSLSQDEKQLFSRQMEVYSAFIAQTDYEIGRLIQAVREGPNGDNTVIFYIVGDNGGEARILDGSEDMSVYLDQSNQRNIEERIKLADELGGAKYTNVYAAGWAWAGSTPFQWTKVVASHFGATRNPLVVSWPSRIEQTGNGLREQFTHVTDIVPTLYEVAGISAPDAIDGVEQEPIDGTSFAFAFNDPSARSRHRTQYFELNGNRAIYHDGWIAAARHEVPWLTERNEDFTDDHWELYDIDSDFSQRYDVSGEIPGKLAELKSLFDSQAKRNDVYPLMKAGPLPVAQIEEEGIQTHVFHSGFAGVAASNGPRLARSSYCIRAQITVSEVESVDGVVTAYGGRDGGFVLYVTDNHVMFESNEYGRYRQKIRDTSALPIGENEIRFSYVHNTEDSGGEGSLAVNSRHIGSIETTIGITGWLDNFDVGRDSASPVSGAYDPPHEFSGVLNRVFVTTGQPCG